MIYMDAGGMRLAWTAPPCRVFGHSVAARAVMLLAGSSCGLLRGGCTAVQDMAGPIDGRESPMSRGGSEQQAASS
jgi:hypothetical protein